ncbi:MAG TPA: zinc finger domain-containing protein, partial [Candidatus Paceibacterota bacterium]|nr:zinc finger domain-containing protein [Candidatus Paceibacterota bacterium]
LVKDGEVEALVNKSYGLDALDPKFSKQYLTEALKRRGKTSIKAALLDQKHLAGIGNIYADEVCFATGILPSRKVSTLSSAKIGEIYTAIKRVLNLAIKHGGTTFTSKVLAGHYIRSDGGMGNFTERLKVFDRTGQQCLRCLATRDPTKRDKIGLIQKTRVAGRGTHFCPVCQH